MAIEIGMAAASSTDTLPLASRRPTDGAFAAPLGGPSAPEPVPRLTTSFLLRALRHRWRLALVVALVGAAAGYGVDRAVPAARVMYSTHALVRVEPADGLPGAAPGRAELRDLRTQAELVKTRFILQAALAHGPAAELPAVRENPGQVLKQLAADLKAEAVGPLLLRISLTGPDPDDLPVLVNAVKDAYLREVVDGDHARRVKRKDFLEATYRDCEARLKDSRKEEVAAGVKPGEPVPADERLTLDRFSALQHELFRVELDLHRSRLDLALGARDGPAAAVPQRVVEELADGDPLVRQYRGRVAYLDERAAHWEQTSSQPDGHDTYRAIRRDRQAAADAVEARKGVLVRRYTEAAAAGAQKLAGESRERTARLEEEEKLIRGLVAGGWDELNRRVKENPAVTLKRFEAERLEGIARQITDELEGLRLEGNAAARTTSLQDATEPVVKQDSKRGQRTGLAVGVAALLAVLCLLGGEARVRRIYGPADVREAVGVRVLGALPWQSRRGPGVAPGDGGWPNALTDAVDMVCAGLTVGDGLGVVMVTSAVPGEGKSSLARILAARLARGGRRTLLVDADLYRPAVHAAFGLPIGPGLGDVLCGTPVAAAVRSTPTDNLFVLTAGTVGPAAFREVARGGLGPLLADLRAAFDAIVVDTSPVLATAQPLHAGRHVDAAVLSTLAGVSRSPLLVDAVRRLSDVGIPVAGVVVNGAAEAGRYGYYFRPTRPGARPALISR